MPFDLKKYPSDWKETVARIKIRARNKCEFCGLPNYAVGYRNGDKFYFLGGNVFLDEVGRGKHGYKESREHAEFNNDYGDDGEHWIVIVLTTAHLNHDTKDGRDENLKALCQKCHLTHDAEFHAVNAAKTLAKKKDSERGLFQGI